MFSSQSSQPPSPSPVFSDLCELSISAFSFLSSPNRGGSSDPRLSPALPFRSPSARSFCGSSPNLQTFQHSNLPTFLSTISFRITFFAHPHHLTPIESHSYKKQGRGWGIRSATSNRPNPFHLFPHPVNIQHTATPATLFLSCVYFILSVTPRAGVHPSKRNSCLARLGPQLTVATHYSPPTTHFFINGNKLGSAGGESAMASNSGYCTRSGSGTFTLERFRILISWRALTTPLP
jgi:hypothetical protein